MSSPSAAAPTVDGEPQGLPPAQRNWVMLCVLCGVSLMSLASAITNVALPTMARDLAASNAAIVWVVNGYQLGVVVCILPAAAMGEILGLKRVYAFGLVMFTLASLGCALSSSLDMLIVSRLLQGASGSCLSAIGPAVIREIYPRKLIGRGLAAVALCVAAGGAAGPTLASLILSVGNWPWLFLVNVPIGLVSIPIFLAMAPRDKPRPRPFDFVGALLCALTLGLMLIGVDSLGGAGRVLALAEIGAGIGFGVLLVWHQSGRSNALLPLDLLRIPLFSLSVVTSMCSYAAQILAYVALPFLFQTELHRSQMATGLLVTPWPLLIVIAAPVAGRLIAHYPAAILGSIGLAAMAAGLALLVALPANPSDWDIIWRMALCGVGFGFFQTPNNATIMTAGPVARSGAAGGMMAVARTLGWCVGSAVVTLIFAVADKGATTICLEVACGFAVVGAVASVSRGAFRSMPR